MSRLVIIIRTDNAAFQDSPEQELSGILRNLSANVRQGIGTVPEFIRDINGNTVGTFTYYKAGG